MPAKSRWAIYDVILKCFSLSLWMAMVVLWGHLEMISNGPPPPSSSDLLLISLSIQ